MTNSARAPRAEHWDGVYTERGDQDVSWYTPYPAVSLELLDAAGIGPDRSVIDVGAGASHLVDSLLGRGHTDVTVLDVSDRGLAAARDRLGAAAGQAHWVVADLLGWQPQRRFGVWHDRAVFHFLIDPADRARYVALLDDALRAGGIVVIGAFAADGPRSCSGLPTARFTPEQLRDVLGGAGRWVELARRRELHTTPTGAVQAFTWLALQRRTA